MFFLSCHHQTLWHSCGLCRRPRLMVRWETAVRRIPADVSATTLVQRKLSLLMYVQIRPNANMEVRKVLLPLLPSGAASVSGKRTGRQL